MPFYSCPPLAAMSLLEHLQCVPDPRVQRTRRHDLIDLLTIALCATVGGADNWVEVAQFGQAHRDWFARFLRLPSGIASHDTFARVFRRLNPEALERACLAWLRAASGRVQGVVAIDGKALRGVQAPGSGQALTMVSAWAADMQMLLGQRRVDGKSNEITAIPHLLDLLDVQGCTVTIDAMGCQKAIARQIVEKGADYVLSLKGNHRHMHEVCKKHFAQASPTAPEQVHRDAHSGHGRTEQRQYWVSAVPAPLERAANAWEQLECIVRVVRTRQVGSKEASEHTSYYVSSLPAHTPAKVLAHSIRAHWSVENHLHWSLDVAFREDECRTQKGHGPHNQALLRRMALQMLKCEGSLKVGLQSKRRRAGWDLAYLARVIGVSI